MVDATKLSERYRLEDMIARGGMGTVYVATDERLGRRVAVKLLKENLASEANFVERFRREARAVAALAHPNIASVFDYGEDNGHPYIVMELIRGRDLAHVLRQEGALDPDRARHIATQVSDALGYAHATGVVHRDVKPANVIVSDDANVKVTDFGIARAAGDTTLTAVGSVLGTAQYISPEQAASRDVGPPSDVYSLGIVLYEMLTGEVPFTGDTPVALAMRHVSEDVPPPSKARPGIPRDLDEIVVTATAKAPHQRYSTGTDMAAALRGGSASRKAAAQTPASPAATAVLEATDLRSTPTDELGVQRRQDRSGVGRAVGVAALLLLLIAGGVLAATLLSEEDGKREPRRERRGSAQDDRPEPSTPGTENLSVPAGLVGSNVHDAEAVLREHGLVPRRQDVASDEDKDTVVDTEPAEGTAVAPGDAVTLLVSLGPPPEEDEGDEGEGGGEGEGQDRGPPDDKGQPPGKEKEKGEGDNGHGEGNGD